MFFGHFHCGADLDERAFADAGAVFAGAGPFLAIFDHFRPERECPALGGFCRMNTATMLQQKRALLLARLAESYVKTSAIYIFLFEGARRHIYELRGSLQIVFG